MHALCFFLQDILLPESESKFLILQSFIVKSLGIYWSGIYARLPHISLHISHIDPLFYWHETNTVVCTCANEPELLNKHPASIQYILKYQIE